jgi:predicted PurR-regulated permease PerM
VDVGDRRVTVSVRTVLTVVWATLASLATIALVYYAWRVIAWVLIALFLAIALDHAVTPLVRRGMPRQMAAFAVFVVAVLVIGALGWFFVWQLAPQVEAFITAVPAYIEELAAGRGPFGALEERFGIVDRVQTSIESGGAEGVLGMSSPLLSALQGLFTVIVALLSILFLTLFMLLEGPTWSQRFLDAMPEPSQPRWRRMLEGSYTAVGGWVTGALLVSVVAGVSTAVLLTLLGVPYALALGLLVAVLDPIPFAGATLGAIIVALVALAENGAVSALIVLAFYVAYQQVENNLILPLVYGRTVQLSPLPLLLAVLIGGELGGIVGVIVSIPIAAALRVVIAEAVDWRRERRHAVLTAPLESPPAFDRPGLPPGP